MAITYIERPAQIKGKTRGQTIIANTDWMGVSVILDGDVEAAPSGHVWRVYENGTNVWKRRRVLYSDRGDRVCTLLSDPKSKLIDNHAALLEIDNEWLYHGIGVDGIQNMLHKVCPFHVSGMSRLDLCIDFTPTEEQAEIIDGLASGRYYVAGKQNGSGFWSINNSDYIPPRWRAHRIPHSTSWGHKTSAVKWKLYYKTKELRDAAGGIGFDKPYIVDQWREAGLTENDVWRLEVSIHNCNSIDFEGERLTQEAWRTQMLHIVRAFYVNRFVVRRNEGHKDKTNDTTMRFLPIDCIRTIRCRKPNGMAQHSGRIALLRHLVKSLEEAEVLLDDTARENVLWHIGQIVENDGLREYFRAMVGDYYEDYIEAIRCDALENTEYSGKVLIEKQLQNYDITPNGNF